MTEPRTWTLVEPAFPDNEMPQVAEGPDVGIVPVQVVEAEPIADLLERWQEAGFVTSLEDTLFEDTRALLKQVGRHD